MMKKILSGFLALALSCGLAFGQVPGQFLGGTVYGNSGATQALASPSATPVLGRVGTLGTLGFRGSTSGTVTVKGAAAAGTWALTLPTTAGSNGQALTTDGAGISTWTSVTATPGGSTTQIQFNNAGALGGSANLTWVSPSLTIGAAGSTTGILKLTGSTSGTISVKGANAAGTWTLTLPTTAGSTGQALTTDGAGVSSWSTITAAAAGSATQLQFNTGGLLAASGNLTWTSPALSIGAAGVTGALKILGSSSGTATIQAQAVAGSPTLTLPTSTGTFAVSASAPLALSATTGALTITGVAGQVLAGSSPAFTATPVLGAVGTLGSLGLSGNTSGVVTLSVQATAGTWTMKLPTGTGTSGQILTTDGTGTTSWANAGAASAGGSNTQIQINNAGSLDGSANLTWVSPKLTIGAAGSVVGQIGFLNATSGSVTLQATTGALGSSVLSLPVGTDTLAGISLTQAFTNKTVNGLNITSTSGTLTIASGVGLTVSSSMTLSTSGNPTISFPSTSTTVAGLGVTNAFTGANSFSGVTTFSGSIKAPVRVVTAAGAITVSASTDHIICVNKTVGAATAVNLPASPTQGLQFIVKDCKGDALTNNITLTPNAELFDGAATKVMSTAFQSIGMFFDGSNWNGF